MPIFPTVLHQHAAQAVSEYFINIAAVDTVLVVNSCARGQAVAESDLDMAILVNEGTSITTMAQLQNKWLHFALQNVNIEAYKKSSAFAHLHVDIITGIYTPMTVERGEPIDFFEVEIGNQICYAAPYGKSGAYFKKLQEEWIPYYDEKVRLERLKRITDACIYDLDHIPYLINRGLHFHTFDILYKAFQEYLQALFIANKTYPIAYNKWIKYQVTDILYKPDLYPLLLPILSVKNLESNELNKKAAMLRELLVNVGSM